jgi:hypothetical protein
MNQNIPSQFPEAMPAWQNIGEIVLPVGLADNGAILSLLKEKLDPLSLPTELLHKIVKSIKEVPGRAVAAGIRFEHIHLFIFIPTNYNTAAGTWGFFRIERIDSEDDNTSSGHAVDLYLYPEAG